MVHGADVDVLIVPGELGPGEMEPVARSLEAHGVSTRVGPVPELPDGLSSLSREQIRALDGAGGGSDLGECFALAVSVGAGAAAAVHTVICGRAHAAILMDPSPDSIIRHWPAAFAMVSVDFQLNREIGKRVEVFDEALMAAGDWTPELVDAMMGVFTGDPARIAQAESAKAYLLSPHVDLRRRAIAEADSASADWVRAMLEMEDSSSVQLWFSEPQHELASYLTNHAQLHALRQPWPDRAWLAETDAVANDLCQQLSQP